MIEQSKKAVTAAVNAIRGKMEGVDLRLRITDASGKNELYTSGACQLPEAINDGLYCVTVAEAATGDVHFKAFLRVGNKPEEVPPAAASADDSALRDREIFYNKMMEQQRENHAHQLVTMQMQIDRANADADARVKEATRDAQRRSQLETEYRNRLEKLYKDVYKMMDTGEEPATGPVAPENNLDKISQIIAAVAAVMNQPQFQGDNGNGTPPQISLGEQDGNPEESEEKEGQ